MFIIPYNFFHFKQRLEFFIVKSSNHVVKTLFSLKGDLVKKKPHAIISLISLIPLVALLALVTGCASTSDGSSSAAGHEPETVAGPSPADLEWSASSQMVSAFDPFLDSDPFYVEFEQSMDLELEGLQSLGQWEEGEPAAVEAEEEIQYDFPVTMNRQVEYYLDFFQNRNHNTFARWLARSGAYRDMIEEYLQEAGLPRDLVFLAMIESGFSKTARSRARAVGMWQFIRATARKYGLTVNSHIDERRDPVKATRAAIEYLSDLYEEFGSWYLAVAGYNAGEGKIRSAVRRQKSTNFWELAQGRHLKLETKRYVPKLIAAIIIAKNPDKYGFGDVEYMAPYSFETIETPRWMALEAVALACNVEVKELQELNRELLKPFTPPDKPSYLLKLPVGHKTVAEKNLHRVHAVVSTNFKTHVVKRHETLDKVCRKYGLTKTIILKANNLASVKLQSGQRLRIPYRTTQYKLLPEGSKAPHLLAAYSTDADFILHKVQPGETVSELAAKYNVPVHLIAGWNDLKDISRIKAGQQLAIYAMSGDDAQSVSRPETGRSLRVSAVSDDGRPAITPGIQADNADGQDMIYYIVRRGDSLWTIARKFNISIEAIRNWNNLNGNLIHPGTTLLIAVDVQPSSDLEQDDRGVYYFVRGGDSLWTIARKFKLPMKQIRELNNLTDDVIYPGNRLLIKLADADV
jgi:membrane-bound lytic murein transglycosylase D